MSFELHFDASACTACQTCVVACMDWRQALDAGPLFAIESEEAGTWRKDEASGCWDNDVAVAHKLRVCRHCEDAPCLGACPAGAFSRDAATGIVAIDENRCNGCTGEKPCIAACPHEALFAYGGYPAPLKCDGCLVRITAGFQPICTDACPTRCLTWSA